MQIVREVYQKLKLYINTPEAIVITGMRRVGKTTLLRHIMQEIESDNKIFIDLENPVNRKHFEEPNYEKILDALRFLGLKTGESGFVFLDEIQFVRQIPSVVKYLADHYRIKFFLSGSSSFYLKNLFSESLSGRKYLFELHPFGFREYLNAKNPALRLENIQGRVARGLFEEIDRYYSDYIMFGGFPGVVLKESVEEKKMMLQDIFSSYFQLEVIQLGDFRKTNVIRDLMLLLMERVGSKLDFQKLSKELGVSRETIYNYMAFLENTYFISLIRPFSRSRDSEIRSMPKFYLCDTGIINHISGHIAGVSEGALFENAVYSAIRDKGEVNYYQRKSGAEVDFILDRKHAYEVKQMPYEQDLKRLKTIAGELNLKSCQIISRRYTELENTQYGFML